MNEYAIYPTRIVLNALLQQCPSEEAMSLAQYLTSAEAQALEKLPKTCGNPLEKFDETEIQLSRIHSSWISPFLRTLPEKEIGFFLSSLDPIQAESVSKDLLYTKERIPLTSLAKSYLQETLLGHLTADVDYLLPVAYLPDSPLNRLLEVRNEILNLSLDYLGLHDVSIEIRQIIEKKN